MPAVHGTPASDMDYLLHEATAAGVLERRGDAVAAPPGDTGDAQVILCGHTHRAPHARRALLERTHKKGARAGWEMTHRMVVYDWERASAEAARHGRAEWARGLATGFTA